MNIITLKAWKKKKRKERKKKLFLNASGEVFSNAWINVDKFGFCYWLRLVLSVQCH